MHLICHWVWPFSILSCVHSCNFLTRLCFFEANLQVQFRSEQYRDLVLLLDSFWQIQQKHQLTVLFQRDRPAETVHAAPRRWWKFACHCIVQLGILRHQQIQATGTSTFSGRINVAQLRHSLWPTPAAILGLVRSRRSYVTLYKRRQRVPWLHPLDAAESDQLEQLQSSLPLEHILFLRSIAWAELEAEARNNEAVQQGLTLLLMLMLASLSFRAGCHAPSS